MSVIRVQKSKNFTVMSNTHLFDKNLSLKAAGLLSKILALPDNWNYSIKGLCAICKESETAVKSALNELRERRYVIVERIEPSAETGGRIQYEYFVYEQPQGEENKKVDVKEAYKAKQEQEKQPLEKQGVENLGVEVLSVENMGVILNTNIPSMDKSNIDGINTDRLNTEKEDKTLSNDNGEVKTSSSENRKKMSAPKTNLQKYLDKKADEQDMMKRLANICISNYNEETAKEIFETIEHYFKRYTEKTGKIHPILKDETLIRIAEKMDCFYDSEYSHFERLIGQDHAFTKMVDMFFDGDFGANKGHETNWHLPAFMTDGILNPLGQRLFELGEVE